MKYSKCKEIDSLVRKLVQQGWVFKWGGKHGRVGPSYFGGKLTIPKTPSDYRAHQNFRRDVRHLMSVLDRSELLTSQ